MRTRSCNVVRATLVACGTIGLLTSLASAQQLSPASSNKGAEAKKLQASKLAPPSVGTTRTPATVKNPVQHIEHAAGGGAVRGPGAATDDCLCPQNVKLAKGIIGKFFNPFNKLRKKLPRFGALNI